MKLLKRSRLGRAGVGAFTLMEIMLVVTIIALLAGMAIYKLTPVIDVAGIARARGDLQTLRTSLLSYRALAGMYPSTEQGLQALVKQPEGNPKPLIWHKVLEQEVKHDPWQFEFVYKCPGEKNPDGYDLYSIGKDGKPGTDDDVRPD